jgi:hypothetical protein
VRGVAGLESETKSAQVKRSDGKKRETTTKRLLAAAPKHAAKKSARVARFSAPASRKIAPANNVCRRPAGETACNRPHSKANADRERLKNLTLPLAAGRHGANGSGKHHAEGPAKPMKDRIVLLVRDAYWLQAV